MREKFQQQEWLHDVMDEMSEQQRRDCEGQGWEVLDVNLCWQVLRKYPELQDIVAPTGTTVPKKSPFNLIAFVSGTAGST